MPTLFVRWCVNQIALWLLQAFIQSKKCNQSSYFSSPKFVPPRNKSCAGKCVMKLVLIPCLWKLVGPFGEYLTACYKSHILVNDPDSGSLFLRIHPKEILWNMINVVYIKLFVTLRNDKQSKSVSTWALLGKLYYTPSVEYFMVTRNYNKYRLAMREKMRAIVVGSQAAQRQ